MRAAALGATVIARIPSDEVDRDTWQSAKDWITTGMLWIADCPPDHRAGFIEKHSQ